jgi:hypothetical protein
MTHKLALTCLELLKACWCFRLKAVSVSSSLQFDLVPANELQFENDTITTSKVEMRCGGQEIVALAGFWFGNAINLSACLITTDHWNSACSRRYSIRYYLDCPARKKWSTHMPKAETTIKRSRKNRIGSRSAKSFRIYEINV